MSENMDNSSRPDYQFIGKPVPRQDAWDKVFGTTKYAEDFNMPGQLYGKVLRTKFPAANILSIDTSEAEKLPGVKAIMTAKDVPNNETVTRFGQTRAVGGFEGLYRVLAHEKIRYKGEGVAILAAETQEIAEKAAGLIRVEYEPLPGVFDPIEAMKPGAYKVGESESNVICSYNVRKGDVKEGFATSDVIVENTFRVPHVEHAFIEPESGLAWVDENGVINIRVCTQVIEHFRGIADVLGVPHNQIRVIAPMLGGGFGSKEDITVETYLALLAWKTGKPVKMTYSRDESIIVTSKRHPYQMKYKAGVTKEGRLKALEVELISDAGGHIYLSPWVLLYSTVMATGPYKIPNVKVDAHTVLTNNTFSSANRGFGGPQVCFAYESMMDELANRLDLSPLDFRKRNYLHKGDALSNGRILNYGVETEQTAERALEALGEPSKPSSPYVKVGKGFASGMLSYGRIMYLHDTSRSYVSVEMDGSVIIKCGVQDIGGGQASSLASIAAEILGVPMEEIKVYFGDTAFTPLAGTTTATRQLFMSGNATLKAAKAVRENLKKKVAEMLEADPEDLEFRNKKVYVKGDPQNSMSLKDAVGACASDGVPVYDVAQFNAPFADTIDFETGQGQIWPDFTFGSIAAEVAVDIETGRVNVLKLVSCFDVGQAINSLSAEGQLEGGAVYGLGYGLMEEVILDKGITMTPSFSEYLLPTAMDVPQVKTIMVESGDGAGPFGAKGIGEPSTVPVAPAIANAVCDAIGARIYDLPLTPEKILKALDVQG